MPTFKEAFEPLGLPSQRALSKRIKRIICEPPTSDVAQKVVLVGIDHGFSEKKPLAVKYGANDEFTRLHFDLLRITMPDLNELDWAKLVYPKKDVAQVQAKVQFDTGRSEHPVVPNGTDKDGRYSAIVGMAQGDRSKVEVGTLYWFLSNERIKFLGVILILVADGASLSLVARTLMETDNLVYDLIFGLIGFVVGYAAFLNSFQLAGVKYYEFDARQSWLLVFGLYQILLHGAAVDRFGSWNEVIGSAIIMAGIPLAGAAIAVTTWKKDEK